jgi:hypothetical protein
MPSARGHRGPVHERRIEDFVQDDPEDSDFEDAAVPRSAKKRRTTTKVKVKSSKRQRRNRRSYDDDDVVDDSEDMESDNSFSEDEPEDVERDPVTGRPKRSAVKKSAANYAESEGSELPDEDEEDVEDVEDSEDELAAAPTPKKTRRRMVVKLQVPSDRLAQLDSSTATRKRVTRSVSVRATSEIRITRASARNTEEPEGLLELTASGRARPAATKGLQGMQRIGGKGLKAPKVEQPSMIMEESQEDSAVPEQEEEQDNNDQGDQGDHDPMVESIEETHLENSQGSPKAAPQSEDDSDDEDPIVAPRRRSMRAVSLNAFPTVK